MDAMIRKLAEAREAATGLKAEYDALHAEMIAEYKERMDQITGDLLAANANMKDADRAIRTAALSTHEETGRRKPHKAVQVKSYTVLGYDPGEAFRYCVQHLTAALKMNKRKFEQVAKVAGLDFVTIGTEPRVTIARDLSGYLAE